VRARRAWSSRSATASSRCRRCWPPARPTREIAEELVVTLDTVKKHVTHILDKLGAANRTQAVTRARGLGLIS
jgi:predicted transcriptional regulator